MAGSVILPKLFVRTFQMYFNVLQSLMISMVYRLFKFESEFRSISIVVLRYVIVRFAAE
jgi:hypothetical protein